MTPRARDAAAWLRWYTRLWAPEDVTAHRAWDHHDAGEGVAGCGCTLCYALRYADDLACGRSRRLDLACYLPDPPLPLP